MDNIKSKYKNYEEISVKYKDKIEQRLSDLHQEYFEFLKNIELTENMVKLNSRVLIHAIMDYFTDIDRLKKFHDIELTNKYKILGYEIYWLLKRKPLQIIDENNENLIYINEKFLLTHTLNFMEKEFKLIFPKELKENSSINGLIQSYYYYLKYRDCNPQALEMIFLSLHAGTFLKKEEFQNAQDKQ